MKEAETLRELVGAGRGRLLTEADPRREMPPPVVEVRNRLGTEPARSELESLERALNGASKSLLEFYRHHNGVDLLCDIEDEGSGLFFYPIDEMEDERSWMLDWFEGCGPATQKIQRGGRLEILGLPSWLDSSIVFGGFGFAPERFLIPTEGELTGRVFLFDHDPHGLFEVASSFEEFVADLAETPTRWGSYLGSQYSVRQRYERG